MTTVPASDLVARLRAMAEFIEANPEDIKAPTVEELMAIVRGELLPRLGDTLEERGRQYGEEVLVVMGEAGIAEAAKMKVYRMIPNIGKGGRASEDRFDSWLDLAGYAILALGIDIWQQRGGK